MASEIVWGSRYYVWTSAKYHGMIRDAYNMLCTHWLHLVSIDILDYVGCLCLQSIDVSVHVTSDEKVSLFWQILDLLYVLKPTTTNIWTFFSYLSYVQKEVQRWPCLWNGVQRPCYLFARKFYPEALNNLLNLFSNYSSISNRKFWLDILWSYQFVASNKPVRAYNKKVRKKTPHLVKAKTKPTIVWWQWR